MKNSSLSIYKTQHNIFLGEFYSIMITQKQVLLVSIMRLHYDELYI